MVKQKKQTTKSRNTKKVVRSDLANDFRGAALVVSVTINVAVFVGWLAIQLTTKYDQEVAQFLFTR
jgi:hypothetical protein